jgi:hypothetical protein
VARTIWVVMGSTGEYSDHRTWLVCAYEDKTRAERHADEAAKRAKAVDDAKCEHDEPLTEICEECDRRHFSDKVFGEWMGDLDPHGRRDYTGTDYVALPVEFRP